MTRTMFVAVILFFLLAGIALAQRADDSPAPIPGAEFPQWPAAEQEALDCGQPFTKIVMRGGFDLFVSIGDKTSCVAESLPRYKPKIELYVQDGVLYLEPEKKVINWEVPRRVLVTAPAIDGIALQGSGNVYFSGKKTGPLSLVIDGSGDMVVSGKAEGLAVDVKGTGDLNGKKLEAGPAEIQVSGAGNVELAKVTDSLKIHVRGSGDAEIEQATVDSATIQLQGSGKSKLAGTAGKLDAQLKGSADLEARDFTVQEAIIVIKGSGDARVQVVKSLTADVLGSGDLTYFGDPAQVKLNNTGSGEIEKGK